MSAILWQRIEGGLVFLTAIILFVVYNQMSPVLPWWVCVLVFFLPDLGFLGYVGGPRVGAMIYNLLHLYGMGLLLAAAGLLMLGNGLLAITGLLWLAHVGFDRMLGYGLKEPSGFNDTHLGRIGRG